MSSIVYMKRGACGKHLAKAVSEVIASGVKQDAVIVTMDPYAFGPNRWCENTKPYGCGNPSAFVVQWREKEPDIQSDPLDAT